MVGILEVASDGFKPPFFGIWTQWVNHFSNSQILNIFKMVGYVTYVRGLTYPNFFFKIKLWDYKFNNRSWEHYPFSHCPMQLPTLSYHRKLITLTNRFVISSSAVSYLLHLLRCTLTRSTRINIHNTCSGWLPTHPTTMASFATF